MTAEGALFPVSQTFDTTGMLGTMSASISWGDGTQTAGQITTQPPAQKLSVKFDYSFDTGGFFSSPARRALLSTAVDAVLVQLTDDLAEIRPSGTNTWTATTLHPSTNAPISIPNLQVNANELIVYVGSQNFNSSQIGLGGPGGFQGAGSQAWLNTLGSRGQAGALASSPTDFGPWGGVMSFSSTANWYFGTDPSAIGSGQFDFLSIASHEFMHVLGFGTSGSWNNLVSGNQFTGANARAAYDPGGNPLLSTDRGHWAPGTTDGGGGAIMTPALRAGVRDNVTPLDMAALDDIGWQRGTTSVVVTGNHVYGDNRSYPVAVALTGSRLGQQNRQMTATITNAAPVMTLVGEQRVIAGQRLQITNVASISDAGFNVPTASPPTTETFAYTLSWGDGSPAVQGDLTIDRVGQSGLPTLASFDRGHTFTTPGTYTASVTVSDDDGGSASGTFRVVVEAATQLSASIDRASIAENAGNNAAILTVSRPQSVAAAALTVTLLSSDISEATVPASVVLAAGQTTAQVAITAVDDNLLDGSQFLTITASAPGIASATVPLTVTDFETLTATFSTDSIREDAGPAATTLTIARSNTDTSLPLAVTVSGNDPARIDLPNLITIPAGAQQVVVPVVPIDDTIAQPPLLLQYQFTAAGYQAAAGAITVLGDESQSFQNPEDQFDVDGNQQIEPLDALRVLIFIGRNGSGTLTSQSPTDGLFVDVNGDGDATPLDALLVLIEISRRQRAIAPPPLI
ncbi:MAG TPA: hypothetical protein DDZ51_11855 [Planctomycetaceae bacterium]|nr:hypothetical protein [Planctomycetaceae bacterium]